MSFTKTTRDENGRPVLARRLDVLVYLMEVWTNLEAAEADQRDAHSPDEELLSDLSVARGVVEGAVRELSDEDNARQLIVRAQRLERQLRASQDAYSEVHLKLDAARQELHEKSEALTRQERQAQEFLRMLNEREGRTPDARPNRPPKRTRRERERDRAAEMRRNLRKRQWRPVWSDEELAILDAHLDDPGEAYMHLQDAGYRRSLKAVEMKAERRQAG